MKGDTLNNVVSGLISGSWMIIGHCAYNLTLQLQRAFYETNYDLTNMNGIEIAKSNYILQGMNFVAARLRSLQTDSPYKKEHSRTLYRLK